MPEERVGGGGEEGRGEVEERGEEAGTGVLLVVDVDGATTHKCSNTHPNSQIHIHRHIHVNIHTYIHTHTCTQI